MKSSILKVKTPSIIPKEKCLDNSIKLLSEAYLFIPSRIRKYNSEIFQTRLMGQKVICMSGKKAATLFYDQNWFTRERAMPRRIQETLFGKNAIQTLTGAAHMHRKLLFMSIMAPDQIDKIVALTKKQWQKSAERWEEKNQVVLFDESAKLLFKVACKWAGVPLDKSEVKQRSEDMSAMIDAFGAVGPRHWKGRCARNRSECWARQIIQDVRSGKLIPSTDSALYQITWHKDLSDCLLDKQIAAVELINILRPITAIATYITFGALALHTYPSFKERLQQGDENYLTMFTQEVRRFYPFGPFLGARVHKNFKWHNLYFKKGTLVLLDLYGTNHDPKLWDKPNSFQPEHFLNREQNPFDFIPQGGGDYKEGTRCPGEGLTVELLDASIDFLANHLKYQVPIQDLTYSLHRIPTLPKSKFIINRIKTKN
jgi:fatty-acid peroxygenase